MGTARPFPRGFSPLGSGLRDLEGGDSPSLQGLASPAREWSPGQLLKGASESSRNPEPASRCDGAYFYPLLISPAQKPSLPRSKMAAPNGRSLLASLADGCQANCSKPPGGKTKIALRDSHLGPALLGCSKKANLEPF